MTFFVRLTAVGMLVLLSLTHAGAEVSEMKITSVPALTFASLRGMSVSKCQRHKEH